MELFVLPFPAFCCILINFDSLVLFWPGNTESIYIDDYDKNV